MARLRVLVATGTALIVPLVAGMGSHRSVQYVVGLGWVPVAGFLAFAVDGRRTAAIPLVGGLCDVAVLVAIRILLPEHAAVVLFGLVAVVLVSAYTGGRAVGLVVAGASIGAVLLARPFVDAPDRHGVSALVLFGLMLGVALLVADRALGERARADDRSMHYRDRADAVLAHVADGVVVTDADGVVVDVNPAAARLLGEPAGDVRRRQCCDALELHLGERPLTCADGCELLALGALPANAGGVEVWRHRPDSSRLALLASASAITSPDGAVREVVHSLRDITRLKLADEAKTLFLATASHELKTPIAVIKGFLQTIDRTGITEEQRDNAIRVMQRRADELCQIIDRVLLAGRIEAGHVDLTTSPLDVGAVVAERVAAIRGSTARTITYSMSVVPLALAAENALATVVDHLLDNAIKYSTDDSPVLVCLTAGERAVLIDVSDYGVGMDAEDIDHCFDKFWQADPSARRRVGGSGIGLYVVRSLVEAMGGAVRVHSAPARGSTFTVELRRADQDTPAPAVLTLAPEGSIVREFMRQIGVRQPGGPS